MKNIINEKPDIKLRGRLLKTTKFVSKSDITDKTILNIGCGYGWFELHAFKKNPKKIVGIEISEEDLTTIKKHIKHHNFSAKIGSAIDIPSKDKTFDTVVSWEVIEHIPKNTENKFFQEVHRVLKKNGVFYLSTPFNSLPSTSLDPAYWLIGHRHYSEKDLMFYAIQNGFTLEKYEIVGGKWTIISGLNTYTSKWIFRRKPFFQDFFLKKEDDEYAKKGYHNIFIKFRKID